MIKLAKDRFMDGKKVTFYEDEHVYKIGKRKLSGATTYIKKFTPIFESEEKARSTAIKNGWTDLSGEPDVDYVLGMWKQKSEESLKRGNKIHKYFEDYFSTGEITHDSMTYITKLKQIPKLGKALEGDNYYIIPEQVIYNKLMDMCGMIDLLLVNKKTDTVSLLDFKTNKTIDSIAFNDERLFSPFQFIPNANYQKYKLQLSIYARILELNGNHIDGMALIHIDHDSNFKLMKLEFDYLEFLRKKFNNPNSLEQQLY